MTQQHTPTSKTALIQPVLIGAGIGLVLISIFLMGVRDANPAWGKFWMIRPLIVVPIAGGAAGLFYYLLAGFRSKGSWEKIIANILSLLVLFIALWLGSILGLAGTLWD